MKNKKLLIVANWKMNPENLEEAKKLFDSIKNEMETNFRFLKNIEVVICPPFIYLPIFSRDISRGLIRLGAQNCFWEGRGPFTGEISPLMLRGLRCQYVILGHSERRQILKETDEMIKEKLKAALMAKLKPILCLGETLKERKKGKTFRVLKGQIQNIFKSVANISNIIIAYEPIWAIGTGNFCQGKEAKKVLFFLRKFFKKNKILYGGSVDSKNCLDYIRVGFNGLLVGGASLRAKEFIQIMKVVNFS